MAKTHISFEIDGGTPQPAPVTINSFNDPFGSEGREYSLVDEDGNNTNFILKITDNPSAYIDAGIISGDDSFCLYDSQLHSNWNEETSFQFEIFFPAGDYSFTIGGSRDTADDRFTEITINGETKTFNSSSNPPECVNFDITGSDDWITVDVQVQSGSPYCYVSGFSIESSTSTPDSRINWNGQLFEKFVFDGVEYDKVYWNGVLVIE